MSSFDEHFALLKRFEPYGLDLSNVNVTVSELDGKFHSGCSRVKLDSPFEVVTLDTYQVITTEPNMCSACLEKGPTLTSHEPARDFSARYEKTAYGNALRRSVDVKRVKFSDMQTFHDLFSAPSAPESLEAVSEWIMPYVVTYARRDHLESVGWPEFYDALEGKASAMLEELRDKVRNTDLGAELIKELAVLGTKLDYIRLPGVEGAPAVPALEAANEAHWAASAAAVAQSELLVFGPYVVFSGHTGSITEVSPRLLGALAWVEGEARYTEVPLAFHLADSKERNFHQAYKLFVTVERRMTALERETFERIRSKWPHDELCVEHFRRIAEWSSTVPVDIWETFERFMDDGSYRDNSVEEVMEMASTV